MLKRRIVFKYGAERSKGKENCETYGEYYTYDLFTQEYIDYLKNLPESQTDLEDYEQLNMPENTGADIGGQDIAKMKALKPRISGFSELKYDTTHEKLKVKDLKPDDYMRYDDEKLVEYREKYEIHDNSVIRPLGTSLIEFLNFDIDNYLEGEFEADIEFEKHAIHTQKKDSYKILLPNRIKGWRRLNNHDISNRKNRHEVLYDFIYGGNDGPGDFSEQKVPFIIRMFTPLMIDFENWTYNEAGIEIIKDIQRKYSDLCDQYYGLKSGEDKSDTRTPLEKYCDTYKLCQEFKEIKDAQKFIRKMAQDACDYAYSVIYYQEKDKYSQGLEQIVNAEFLAMISKPSIFLKRCEYCDRYFLANAGGKYCTSKISLGIFKEVDNTDVIYQMPTCSEIATNINYNAKKKETPMSTVFFAEKRRLEANMQRFLRGIDIMGYDELHIAMEKARNTYEANYIKKTEGVSDEVIIRKYEEEYRTLLIDAVNTKLKEISPAQYRARNFDRRKNRK